MWAFKAYLDFWFQWSISEKASAFYKKKKYIMLLQNILALGEIRLRNWKPKSSF